MASAGAEEPASTRPAGVDGRPVFVTGAAGFVGAAVTRALLARGHAVRALVRQGSDRRNLEGLVLEVVEGDLREPAGLAEALRGCRFLCHVAADYRLWVPDPEAMRAVNVGGTAALMQAALAAGIERIVHTSSVATLGHRPDGTPADEGNPGEQEPMIGAYKRTKLEAEILVRRMIREEGLPAVIVNPAAPVGPRDRRPTPTGRMVLEAAAGRMPAYVDTSLNLVHVDDVGQGHLLALRRGRIGERYILGSENLTLARILTLIAELTGRRPPRWRLPLGAVLPLALMGEAWGRLSGRPPRVSLDELRMARRPMVYSSQKAIAELGYAPRPARLALADAIAWFHANGYLPDGLPPKGRSR